MTRSRRWLYTLLAVVGSAAILLSFDALRGLAEKVKFGSLDVLLPVVVDAGAIGAALVWLSSWAPDDARKMARGLALILLGGSVGGNALSHWLDTSHTEPHWVVIVAVSAVAPSVAAALVHLAVLCTRPDTDTDAADPVMVAAAMADSPALTQMAGSPNPMLPTPQPTSPAVSPAGVSADPGTPLEQRLTQIRDRYQTSGIPLAEAVAQVADAYARAGQGKPSRRVTARALGHPDDHSATRKAWEALS